MMNKVLDRNELSSSNVQELMRFRNQSSQSLGNKKRSLKARMHSSAIQSYLGLAITGDPLSITGLHKSNHRAADTSGARCGMVSTTLRF